MILNFFRNKQIVFYNFILLYFIASVVSSLFNFYGLFFFKFTTVINVVFEIILVLYIFSSRVKWQRLIAPFLLVFFFFGGQLALKKNSFNISNFDNLISELNYTRSHLLTLNNYVFIFLFYIVFDEIENKTVFVSKAFRFLFFVFCINSFFVLIGLFTGFDLFKSYPFSNRFGYIGLFHSHTIALYLYCFLIVVFYKKFLIKKEKIFELGYVILFSLLLGKKAILVFLFLLFFHYLFYSKKLKIKYILVVLLSIITVLIAFKDLFFNLFLKIFPFWKEIYHDGGELALLTSSRSLLLESFIELVKENWTIFNYFLGGALLPKSLVQYDIVDLFAFFGIFGLAVYLYFFSNLLKLLKEEDVLLMMIILFIAAITGLFITNVTVMIWFVYLIYYLKFQYNKNLDSKEVLKF